MSHRESFVPSTPSRPASRAAHISTMSSNINPVPQTPRPGSALQPATNGMKAPAAAPASTPTPHKSRSNPMYMAAVQKKKPHGSKPRRSADGVHAQAPSPAPAQSQAPARSLPPGTPGYGAGARPGAAFSRHNSPADPLLAAPTPRTFSPFVPNGLLGSASAADVSLFKMPVLPAGKNGAANGAQEDQHMSISGADNDDAAMATLMHGEYHEQFSATMDSADGYVDFEDIGIAPPGMHSVNMNMRAQAAKRADRSRDDEDTEYGADTKRFKAYGSVDDAQSRASPYTGRQVSRAHSHASPDAGSDDQGRGLDGRRRFSSGAPEGEPFKDTENLVHEPQGGGGMMHRLVSGGRVRFAGDAASEQGHAHGYPQQHAQQQQPRMLNRPVQAQEQEQEQLQIQLQQPRAPSPTLLSTLFGGHLEAALMQRSLKGEELEPRGARWSECEMEEWIKGGDEMVDQFREAVDVMRDNMAATMKLFQSLNGHIAAHRQVLAQRQQTLDIVNEDVIRGSGSVLRGSAGANVAAGKGGEEGGVLAKRM